MSENIIRTCRYGHGILEIQDAGTHGNQLFSVDTFPHVQANDKDGFYVVFSFKIYKCPKCSYLEFHDEV